MSGESLAVEAELVRSRAADLASTLARAARRSTTLGQERAILRMVGLDGVDRDGMPLASSLAERYCGAGADRLAAGALLPLAAAQVESGRPVLDVALDAASGELDLSAPAALLGQPERLAAARGRAGELLAAALARIDANRTAAREMRDVLGLPREPWLGFTPVAAEVEAAAIEVRSAIARGAGVVEICVPATWEFAEARRQAGLATPQRIEAGDLGLRRRRRWLRGRQVQVQEPIPAGSQRGLANLRRVADNAGAERGIYAGLMTVTSSFAAPEQAVVAAFERIDYVEADPIREIVEDNIEPDRVLGDHAFAHRLQVRAGSRLVIGPGPLALGSEVATGIPSDAETRAGRTLALQALGVELALGDGVPTESVLVGAVPEWVALETDPSAVMLQAWLRRAVFPGHRLVVACPPADRGGAASLARVAPALAAVPARLVMVPSGAAELTATADLLSMLAAGASAVRDGLADGMLRGGARERGRVVLEAAAETLARLGGEGWDSLLGPEAPGWLGERLGRTALVERSDGPASAWPLLGELQL